LIDGYNLLHVTGIVGRGKELTELHRSREALLRFLSASIEPAERTQTTIVFDAAGAPPGLPQTLMHDSMTVHFARDYADADAMIEDLVAAHHTPRSLVVVSSDHRIQRAARRRRAKAVDSDRWYAELWAARHRRGQPPLDVPQKPGSELTAADVSYWLKQFAESAPDEPMSRAGASSTDRQEPIGDDLANPFPPGYAEDLLDETD
jgi:predicted RNA-binding protein with PIN domain